MVSQNPEEPEGTSGGKMMNFGPKARKNDEKICDEEKPFVQPCNNYNKNLFTLIESGKRLPLSQHFGRPDIIYSKCKLTCKHEEFFDPHTKKYHATMSIIPPNKSKILSAQLYKLYFHIYLTSTITLTQAKSNLYCLSYYTGPKTASALPNDRCCPTYQSQVFNLNGNGGVPYSSTIKGCCGGQIYDLYNEVCCGNGEIVDRRKELERPGEIEIRLKKLKRQDLEQEQEQDEEDMKKHENALTADLTISWTTVENADTYEIETSTAFNNSWTQLTSHSNILGKGDTMGLSISLLQNLLLNYSYKIKVRAIDCINRMSEWKVQKIKITENGRVLYLGQGQGQGQNQGQN